MEKLYDKIILLIVIIALIVTVFLTLGQYNNLQAFSPELPESFETLPYESVKADQKIADEVVWNEPTNQREEEGDGYWVYSVFTPPKIYLDKNGGFTATPQDIVLEEEKPEPPKPFGVIFTKAVREKFRYQFNSFSGTVDNARITIINADDPSDSVTGRVGETDEKAGIKFISFKEERVENMGEFGIEIVRVASLTVRDLNSGKEFELTNRSGQETVYTGLLELTFVSQNNPENVETIGVKGFNPEEDPLKTLQLFSFDDQFQYKLTQVFWKEREVFVSKINKSEGTSIDLTLKMGVEYDIEGNLFKDMNQP